MSNYAKEACKTIFSIKDMLHPLSSFILQSHWGNQDKILIWQQLSGRSYWHKVNKFILGQLIWVQQVCSGWKFYCKKNFLSPYIVRCLPHGSFSPSGRRANLHLVRFAKAFVSLKIQIFILQKQLLPTSQKHLSVSCCQLCQSYLLFVANFPSLCCPQQLWNFLKQEHCSKLSVIALMSCQMSIELMTGNRSLTDTQTRFGTW